MQQNIINIKALDMDGRGVGHLANEDGTQGKVIFVEGALPGELNGCGLTGYSDRAHPNP